MSTKVFNLIRLAPAGLLALALVTACTKNSEKTVVNGDTAVTEPAPPPNIIPEPNIDQNGTSSATTTGMDSGTATATTDTMSGVEPKKETAPPAPKAMKSAHKSGKMKSKKTTKTETTETKTPDVGAVSPIYDSTDAATESGTTTSASMPATSEISTPILSDYSIAPGRAASALTDWGVSYRINDAEAASTP